MRRPDTASSSATSEAPSADGSARSAVPEAEETGPESATAINGKEDETPQASRRVSASDIQNDANGTGVETASPMQKAPQRSSSGPLPATPPSLATSIQRTISQAFGGHLKGGDSPVMNETLSVIDEHITDLSTPRHSITPQDSKTITDSGSEYSSHISHRLSYIHGHETDEEEENQPTEEEVRKWDHLETARQLQNIGVDSKHIDIFQEQEITGDVLLEMDQEFLFMKEFDFGVMGRRLKSWHKIKAFQEQVRGSKPSTRGSVASYYPLEESERSTSRTGHNGSFLPRIPSLSAEKRPSPIQSPRAVPPRRRSSLVQGSPNSPSTANTFGGREFPGRRPSAASIRELNHSRRHSSIDSTHHSPALPSHVSAATHQKKGSFDRSWTMSASSQPFLGRPSTAAATDEDMILQQRFLENNETSDSTSHIADTLDALDRGYFSGGEVETRRTKKLLRKRDSAMGSASHSRQSSYVDDQSQPPSSNRRHSRFGSTDSGREPSHRISAAAKFYHSSSLKGRIRSAGSKMPEQAPFHPIVTNLEQKPSTGPSFFSPFAGRSDSESTGRSSPLPFQQIRNVGPKFRRAVGLRTASDSVNGDKIPEPSPASPIKDFAPTGRTGSTTPSATSKSSERHSTDGSGKATEGTLSLSRPRAPSKVGSKTKKNTSAYIRGLEKKSPQEQMLGCDYSGWMKKRSANLMTTWKPRLFVLRGRRLSYYYSENDTEERGLIDISAHRVLRADQDPLTALHATITGATSSPTSPINVDWSTKSPANNSSETTGLAKTSSDSPFFFKLVPPKTGVTRSVQFTKPATHYFQVDSVREGRLWMAALVKATIDRDLTMPVETTNKQKTVSLKQARAMNQRPPALMGPPELESIEADVQDDHGLKIQGLNLEKTGSSVEPSSDELLDKEAGRIQSQPTSSLPDSLVESIS